MRSLTGLVLAASMLVPACTHRRDITEVHEVSGERVTVSDSNGKRLAADAVAVPGGVTFVDARGAVVPADAIYRVERKHRVLGGLEGLSAGLLVGFVGGLVTGGGDEDDDDCKSHADCTDYGLSLDISLTRGLVVGAIGGLAGLVIGAAIGATVTYDRGGAAVQF
jgi:hypothetical protein